LETDKADKNFFHTYEVSEHQGGKGLRYQMENTHKSSQTTRGAGAWQLSRK